MLRFRHRLKSVNNVLKSIRTHGFSDTRTTALWDRWVAVTRLGSVGPVTSFEPWTHRIPPDLHGFYKWVMDVCSLLNEVIIWSNWIRLLILRSGSGRISSIPPRIWFVARRLTRTGLGFWFNQRSLMLTFARHGCHTCGAKGIKWLLHRHFLTL